MNKTITENQKNIGTFIHASTFLKYFFPLANFFAPLLLWTLHKEKRFLDHHGREAINFQLSVFVYALGIALLSLPFIAIFATDFISLFETIDTATDGNDLKHISNLGAYITLFTIFGMLLFGLFIFEVYCVIMGTLSASRGENFKYPWSINFITASKTTSGEEDAETPIKEDTRGSTRTDDANISGEKQEENQK